MHPPPNTKLPDLYKSATEALQNPPPKSREEDHAGHLNNWKIVSSETVNY